MNAGSSSLKFGLYATAGGVSARGRGAISDLGGRPQLVIEQGERVFREALQGPLAVGAATRLVCEALARHGLAQSIRVVAHRIVHGGAAFKGPAELTPSALTDLRALAPLAPLHQQSALEGVAAAQQILPAARQVGCFDTAFHQDQPRSARLYALPRRLIAEGVLAYGFHGLSYAHVARRLRELDPERAGGRAIVAHLGSGASLCALDTGRSVATTMGFSTLDGVPMSTRCGAIDPGVILYLLDHGITADGVRRMLYEESGLLGLSGISHDMRELLASPAPEAAEAVEFFVYRVGREIGSLSAALGGLDTLVFTAGIGEGSPEIRQRIAEQAAWLGLRLDPTRNAAGATEIGVGPVRVLVLPADEELAMAEAVYGLLRS